MRRVPKGPGRDPAPKTEAQDEEGGNMVKNSSSGSSNRKYRSDLSPQGSDDQGPKPSGPAEESKPPEDEVGPRLILVATPIGNAGDLGYRSASILAGADLIACEDTRVTAKLLAIYKIQTPTLPYHDHNARQQLPLLMERFKNGETVALVSDAGTPLVSDPGYRLVEAALAKGVPVTAVPGPSAVMAALVLSGLPTDRFFFQGFLPNKARQRRAALRSLAAVPGSLVILESAKRLTAMLSDAAVELGERPAAVTRELTKKFEEVRRDRLGMLAAHYAEAGAPKGEVTVVIGPPEANGEVTDAELDLMLRDALQGASVRDAAATVAAATGIQKRRVYAHALALGKGPT